MKRIMPFIIFLFVCVGLLIGRCSYSKADEVDFDYYLLAMSWAPSFCHSHPYNQTPECTQPYKFVLHGLWPQYENGKWPQNCHFYGDVTKDVTQLMIDIMPSESLINHEYSKHGTCTGLEPQEYFELARTAYEKVVIPQELNVTQTVEIPTEALAAAFLKANPWLSGDSIHLQCSHGRHSYLTGVNICVDKKLSSIPCSLNTCQNETVTVTPPHEG